MNYINNIRIKIGAYLLKQKLKKLNRKPVICNLKQAKSIGVVFNSLLSDDLKTVKKLEAALNDQNILVETLGFTKNKKNGETLISDRKHHYAYQDDLSWFFIPKSPEIKSFLSNPYDILINLYQEDIFAIETIIKTSNAKFKVGCAHFDKSLHDLMIDVSNNKGDSAYLAEQINHYLSIIHS